MTDAYKTAIEAMAQAIAGQMALDDNDDPDLAKAALSALLAALPALGWQLVPVVATDGMDGIGPFDGTEYTNAFRKDDFHKWFWPELLAAAPKFGGPDA
jgi:hypothetical protein